MYIGKLIPFHQPGMPMEPEVKVEVSFWVYLQEVVKIFIDHFPQHHEADYSPEELGVWRMDCIGHIRDDEFFVHADHVEFVVGVYNVRDHLQPDGSFIQERCIKFYILKLDYEEDQPSLGYALDQYEKVRLLLRKEPVSCTPSRGF